MKGIIIRSATMLDCHELSVLKRDVWNTTYKGIYSQERLDGYDLEKNAAIFQSIVENPEIELYVAEKDSQLIGLMTIGRPYYLFREYDQEVGLLYIRKEYQRKGLGKRLLNKAWMVVTQKGCDRFIVSVNSRNENAIAFYLAMGGQIVCEEEGQKRLLFENLQFVEGLERDDEDKLLGAPKSDIHNHSSKGCRRSWLEQRLKIQLPKPPVQLNGLDGMHEWFTNSVKPYCRGKDGIIVRWEGAFEEAQRNNIMRLAMNFGVQDIELVGGMEAFVNLIEGYRLEYCPDTLFEPEITYGSFCNVAEEVDRLDRYISSGFFKSIDVCGGENVQSFEAFLPLYQRAEQYHLVKRMHVGETGSAEDIRRAVEILGLEEIHHGINAVYSQDLMNYLADNQIQLNVCPSSNVMLGYVPNYAEHPIRVLYESGVKLTINTDDLLLFNSSIENEYRLLYKNNALNAQQLNDIRRNGLRK